MRALELKRKRKRKLKRKLKRELKREQASKQASRQALRGHSVGAMPCRGLFKYVPRIKIASIRPSNTRDASTFC